MNEDASFAVAQAVDEETWATPTSIPTDDSAVLTTFLPLATLLVVYGAILVCSLRPGASDPWSADTLIARVP
jgi:hypothetical protein